MLGYDINQLERELTVSELEAASNMYDLLRERGYTPQKAVGMVYRAGRLTGKKSARDYAGKEIGRLQQIIKDLKTISPPEANEVSNESDDTQEEGSLTNE